MPQFDQTKTAVKALASPYRLTPLLLATAAGLCYASFPLAYWLNHPHAWHGEVSILGEAGQPYAGLFNNLDIVSGILLILLCSFLLITRRQQMTRPWRWATILLLCSAIGSIAAAALPLPTVFQYPNNLYALLHIGLAVFEHGFASFINTGAFIASTLLWIRTIRSSARPSRTRLLLAYSIVVIVTVGPIASFFLPTTGDYIQRAFISLFAIWLVIFTYDALTTQRNK